MSFVNDTHVKIPVLMSFTDETRVRVECLCPLPITHVKIPVLMSSAGETRVEGRLLMSFSNDNHKNPDSMPS